MTYLFRVKIPFIPIIHETTGTTIQAELPAGIFELSKSIQLDVSTNSYVANVTVEAMNPSIAIDKALRDVEEFLALLAIGNDAFGVMYSGIDVEIVAHVNPDPPRIRISETDPNSREIYVSDTVFARGHLGLVKKKGGFRWEGQALQSKEAWPAWMSSVLELNYLAVMASQKSTKFLLLVVTLEAIVREDFGYPQALIPARLDDKTRRRLEFEVEDIVVKRFGFTNDESNRIVSQMRNTHSIGMDQHFLNYLVQSELLDYSKEEVGGWWRLRGKIAHGGSAASSEELGKAFDRLSQAIRSILRRKMSELGA